ncbi:hypothetical protein DH2020_023180 [Rehmannia glutinosa]|uniref:START domain-containing protein n=1 Tax=Rehmannia glutinosa TaxID=99300 RepID=A0ABR0W5A5_REHGL
MSIKDAMRNPICTNCGGPAMIGEISLEEQHLRIENARLKDELDRVCALAGKFLGRPISALAASMGPPMPNSSLELGVGSNGFGGLNIINPSTLPLGPPDFGGPLPVMPSTKSTMNNMTPIERSLERSMYLELALAAMDELVKMAQTDEPIWLRSLEGGREVLNHEEYLRTFTPCIGMKPNGFVTEASRESGMVIINGLALVETLMDSMHAELQVLSPLVPVREVNFLRFCKQHAEGVWAVVDVSIDAIRETSSGGPTYPSCRRLPSGCVVQDMPNGYSKVTWVEHAEYDESLVPALPAFDRCRYGLWRSKVGGHPPTTKRVSGHPHVVQHARQRSHCDNGWRAAEHVEVGPTHDEQLLRGRVASTVHKWNKLRTENVDEDVRVMTRKSVDDPGEPGIVLSAATSVWLPVSPQRLFDFLRNEHLRSEWDILSNGGPMQEMAHIAKGQDHGNCVSLLRASAMHSNQSSMLILQETCIDAAGSLVVYAPVDIPAMHVVMNGGDSAYVALLPSGFAIVPDGPMGDGPSSNGGPPGHRVGGSLLTVAFQILVNSLLRPSSRWNRWRPSIISSLAPCRKSRPLFNARAELRGAYLTLASIFLFFF